MHRYMRIIAPVLALLFLVAGVTLADRGKSHGPEAGDQEQTENESSDEAISDTLLDRIVASLADEGIDTDADTLRGLAEEFGVGGAVRLLTWADATGKDPSELADLFDSGMGWGAILHQLKDEDPSLDLSPGVGWIMSHGHAHGGGAGGNQHDESKPGD